MNKVIYQQLSAWLLVLLLVMGGTISAFASEVNQAQVRLRRPDSSGNVAFSVENMFPGDVEINDFTVKVSHKKPITVYYHAAIRSGYEKLSEVMMVKVELPEEGLLLYDGLMRDMPSALEHQLEANEKEVIYRITAYLDTSVGNEYQFQSLAADFRWWYLEEIRDDNTGDDDRPEKDDSPETETVPMETEVITDPTESGDISGGETTDELGSGLLPDGWQSVKTGDDSKLELYMLTLGGSLTGLFLCLIWRRKERRAQRNE